MLQAQPTNSRQPLTSRCLGLGCRRERSTVETPFGVESLSLSVAQLEKGRIFRPLCPIHSDSVAGNLRSSSTNYMIHQSFQQSYLIIFAICTHTEV
jgi:hypothetical protein